VVVNVIAFSSGATLRPRPGRRATIGRAVVRRGRVEAIRG
jgi:hypothetical protein